MLCGCLQRFVLTTSQGNPRNRKVTQSNLNIKAIQAKAFMVQSLYLTPNFEML